MYCKLAFPNANIYILEIAHHVWIKFSLVSDEHVMDYSLIGTASRPDNVCDCPDNHSAQSPCTLRSGCTIVIEVFIHDEEHHDDL